MEEPVSTDSGSVFRKETIIKKKKKKIIKLFNYFIVARRLRNSFTERWYRHFYCLTMRQQARVFYEQIALYACPYLQLLKGPSSAVLFLSDMTRIFF